MSDVPYSNPYLQDEVELRLLQFIDALHCSNSTEKDIVHLGSLLPSLRSIEKHRKAIVRNELERMIGEGYVSKSRSRTREGSLELSESGRKRLSQLTFERTERLGFN